MDIIFILSFILILLAIVFWILKILLKDSISNQLNKLDKNEYIKINDNIIISIYGIFLINEYKQKDLKNDNYINIVYRENKKLNRKIKKYLSEYSEIIFHQIIVNNTENVIKNNNQVILVIKLNELFMNIITKKDRIIFTYNQIYEIKNRIKKINKIISQKNICPYCGGKLIKKKIGSDLIIYTGTNDLFICSNSPKCKYSRTYNRIDNPYE
ncbi:MAG: hypothetical protein FWD28_09375 [Treponema sp.]|nr:hypothetical protein [Treponema sp.]